MIFDVCMGFNHHYRSWPFGLTCCTKILQENDNIIIHKLLSHTCRWAMAIILTISVKRKIKPTRTWDHLCYIMKNYRKLRFQKMKYNCTSGRLLMDDVLKSKPRVKLFIITIQNLFILLKYQLVLAIFPSQLEKILHQFDSPTCTLECTAEERKKIQPIFTILLIKW